MADPAPRSPTLERHDPYVSLRYPAYRWYVLSYFTATLATQIRAVVVGWQIYAITHDPLSLGLIGLAEVLPFVSFSVYAGHVADIRNRRVISLVALAVLLACGASLLAVTITPGLLARHGPWLFYVAIAAGGLARSFLNPARQALGAELIPREIYGNAVAWRSSVWQTGAVLGPALGGLLYGFASPAAAYATDTALMLVALVTFAAVGYLPTVRAVTHEPILSSLWSGVRFVFGEKAILGAMTLDLFSVFLGGAEALLPVFADQVLHVGPQGLGVLRAAPAAGAVVMSLYLAHRPPLRQAGRTMLGAVAGFALCIIVFGLSQSFWLSLGVLALSGMADNVSVLVRSTLIQVMTPTALLGRVSSVNSIFVGSSNELGAFESGVTARLLGAVPAVVLGGLASLGVVGLVTARVPELRRLRRISER